jgi:hypothetical protein
MAYELALDLLKILANESIVISSLSTAIYSIAGPRISAAQYIKRCQYVKNYY